jgi:DNA repair exonuclease SbcCD ATPase subunit
MPEAVDVVAAYAGTIENVALHAEQEEARQVETYRRLVIAMAESGGALPKEQAAELLAVCEALGVSPDRLSQDAATVNKANRLQATIDEIHKANAGRLAPLPELERQYQEAQAEWLKVSSECRRKMDIAQKEVNQRRQAFEKLQNSRGESATYQERDLMKVTSANPHLFGTVTREQLKRIVSPDRTRIF